MSFGLSDQGFSYMTGSDILVEIGDKVAGRPGIANLRRDGEGRFANFASPYAEQGGRIWETLAALYFSMDPATASGVSLDARGSEVLTSRLFETQSTVPLTLYNRSASSPVQVLAGNQVMQSATGTPWTVLEDVTIPALTVLVSSAEISSLEWRGGVIVRASVPLADLSGVAIGDTVSISGADNASNDGEFTLSNLSADDGWIEYPNPSRTNDTDDETGSGALADIQDVESFISVTGQAVLYGPLDAAIGTIDTIQTPVSGWDAVTNLVAATVGRSTQTDTEYRRDILNSPVRAKGGTVDSIVTRALREVPGCTYATGEENDEAYVVDGMAPHSYRFTFVGGTDQALWNLLGSAKGGGIKTNGSVVGTYTDPRGVVKFAAFNRVDEIAPYILYEIVKGPKFPTATAPATIRAALNAIEFAHGNDLLGHEVEAVVTILKLPDTRGVVAKMSRTPGPTSTDNLPIDADEVVSIDPNRITFVFTDG